MLIRAAVVALLFATLAALAGGYHRYQVAVAVPLVLTAFVPRAGRAFRMCALYIGGFALFVWSRGYADDIGMAVWDPGVIDAAVFGAVPTTVLQRATYTPGAPSLFDYLMLATYLTYFASQSVVAVALWAVRSHLFARYVVAGVAMLLASNVAAALAPAAPPWMAGTHRIVTNMLAPGVASYGQRVAGTNEVAAMPSVHMAVTWLIVCAAWQTHWTLRLPALLYAAAMALALVYMGEHYVVDLLMGVAITQAAWWWAGRHT